MLYLGIFLSSDISAEEFSRPGMKRSGVRIHVALKRKSTLIMPKSHPLLQ